MNLKYYILNKPFGYQSQFSGDEHLNLMNLVEENNLQIPKDIYPVGRLDKDSEGLLILTNDKKLHTYLLNPKHQHKRSYWAQVDKEITQQAITDLQKGVTIRINKKAYLTKRAKATIINEPAKLWERNLPVRFRANIPSSWLNITLIEGKNRQVRKMTAKVGFPTLRLVRNSIESLNVWEVKNGAIKAISKADIYELLKI